MRILEFLEYFRKFIFRSSNTKESLRDYHTEMLEFHGISKALECENNPSTKYFRINISGFGLFYQDHRVIEGQNNEITGRLS